jgi:hypothetical protein
MRARATMTRGCGTDQAEWCFIAKYTREGRLQMEWTLFTGALAFVTLGIAVGFALYSKRKVDERRKDPNAPKSTLAADQSSKADPADV